MANIKNIVKVMNFHSLIRVDKAKRDAEKFRSVETELNLVLSMLLHNRNLKLDQKLLDPNPDGVTIKVYLGNDLGFCGSFNAALLQAIRADKESLKIIIGRKIKVAPDDKVLLQLDKEEFFKEYQQLSDLIYQYVSEKKVKEILAVSNYYHSVSNIQLESRTLYPITLDDSLMEQVNLDYDFVVETSINKLITSVACFGICYQIKMLERNCFASENVMREGITRTSIKKIEENEAEAIKEERKAKKEKNFKKQISNSRILED